MTLWYYLESLSWRPHKKGWLCWEKGLARTLRCPACHTRSTMQTPLSIASPFVRNRRFRLYDCPECNSKHCPDLKAPAYEDQSLGGLKQGFEASKKFYVEQGAGLESMIAPFFWLRGKNIESLLEVGCGYGFSLDFARQALGWKVQGIDPSHIARTGAEELGLPVIDGYLNDSTRLDGMPFDLVFSSEVIEHIADPDPFVAALAMAAGKTGTVMLTTPDVAGLQPDRPLEEVIPLLSPGSHLVLFSREGLEACLQRAGFDRVVVSPAGDTLHAFADNAAAAINSSAFTDMETYRKYLTSALHRKSLPAHLVSGFSGRLLRLQTDAGDYQGAQETWRTLVRHWSSAYAIDLDAPDSIQDGSSEDETFVSLARSRPFNLTAVLYCGGMLALNANNDPALARSRFAACIRSYEVMEAVLSAVNVTDLQSRMLAQRAQALLVALVAQDDPARAVALYEKLDICAAEPAQDFFRQTRLQVFAAAANTGDFESALRMRDDIGKDLQQNPCRNAFERAAALGLAMMALNHDFDRKTGLVWLQKALAGAPKARRYEDMRKVWARHASAHGIELLNHGGQKALAARRDDLGMALKTAALIPEDLPVMEGLSLAYAGDAPDQALLWFEKALSLANAEQRDITMARLREASTRIFCDAVNNANHEIAAAAYEATAALADETDEPGPCFALGLDALNRCGDLDAAQHWFEKAAAQDKAPEMAAQGAFHLALVLARQGQAQKARRVATALYAPTNSHARLVRRMLGPRAAELDAAIASAA